MVRIDPELLSGFVAEARSYLPRILKGVEALTTESLGEARRLVHSIKGAASMLGLAKLSELAYGLEQALEGVVHGDATADLATRAELVAGVSEVEAGISGLLAENRFAAAPPPERPHPSPPAPPAPPPTFAPSSSPELVPELVESFLDEAEDHLTTIAQALAEIRQHPDEQPALGEIRRSVHTLKGTAALVGFGAVSRLAHRMEDLLDQAHEQGQPLSHEDLDLLYATADGLADAIGAGAEGQPNTEPASFAPLYERYRQRMGDTSAARESRESWAVGPPDEELRRPEEPRSFSLGQRPRSLSPPTRTGPAVRVPLDRLEELVRLTSELVVNRSTFEQFFGNLKRQVSELELSMARLRRVAGRLESDYEVAALAGQGLQTPLRLAAGAEGLSALSPKLGASHDFDELELDRYTEFHRVSRELAETSSDLGALGGELGGTLGDFDAYLARLNRLTGEVQDRLLTLRMVPVGTLAARLERAVRVTADAQGKAADLVIEGAQVEIDKTVLEEIADPLLHLMRNAVDHGLEPPALRRVLGKGERGRIRLKATHEGTQVVLQVTDDGAGVDSELIREAAVSGGFLAAAEAAELDAEDLFSLLFLPGFSTAGQISEISGRGVGLDVVKTAVARLKGTVSLDSKPEQGTTITVRLPLTLAILKVLMVTAGRETYALPLAVVTQILRLERDEIEHVGQEPVVRVGGEVLPLVHLGEVLGSAESALGPEPRMPVLVVALPERKFGLAVRTLIEARDVVVKPLGAHLKRVHGFTGATLTGDGSVVLILNPAELVERRGDSARRPLLATRAGKDPRARRALTVLIADDSLSVRRVLSGLVKSVGWTPLTARDGVEALEILEVAPRKPDVVLLDIEMPRMDGYELTAHLKANPALARIPIVMLTSRAGEKHRDRAFELGVADYVAKPYQDEALLAILRRAAESARAEEELARPDELSELAGEP